MMSDSRCFLPSLKKKIILTDRAAGHKNKAASTLVLGNSSTAIGPRRTMNLSRPYARRPRPIQALASRFLPGVDAAATAGCVFPASAARPWSLRPAQRQRPSPSSTTSEQSKSSSAAGHQQQRDQFEAHPHQHDQCGMLKISQGEAVHLHPHLGQRQSLRPGHSLPTINQPSNTQELWRACAGARAFTQQYHSRVL